MKLKLLFTVLLLLFASVASYGQVTSQRVIYTTSNPPVSCASGRLYTNGALIVKKVWLGLANGTCQQVDASAAVVTPGGSNTQVQFNDSSAFGGDAGLTYNKTTDTLTSGTFVGALTGTASGNLVSGGALGSPSSVGTLPAFTLGGTVSGGGNQVNNVIIGTTTPLAAFFTAVTETGQHINSLNGAASTPPEKLTGTFFTGGTATTTKPQLLVEPAGTTTTGWSTSGTGVGVNAASGFTGNTFDAQVAGVSHFSTSSGTNGVIVKGVEFRIQTAGGGDGKVRFIPNTQLNFSSDLILGFASATSTYSANADVTFTRQGAGTLQIGTGTTANSAGSLKVASYLTDTNCADSAGAAACGSATAGHVVIDAGSTSVVVSTTGMGANSQATPTFDSSVGTRLGITCNTTIALPAVTARTVGSFTITVAVAPITNPACFGYIITN